jgi:xanthine/CO dehydrogenase XdhC/CoxF family maturation factor
MHARQGSSIGMSTMVSRLLPLFERERLATRAAVMATVVRTDGPTYTKPGALMLIGASGEYAGLLSGGCLEGDLAEHGRSVLEGGAPLLVHYDMHGPDDLLFGLGSGCEGAMDILLQRLDPASQWQPLTRLVEAWRAREAAALLLVARSGDPALPAGSGLFLDTMQPFGALGPGFAWPRALLESARTAGPSRFLPAVLPDVDLLCLHQPAPPRIVLLGAGPDALPVAQLADFLGWSLTVIDHRSHYAQSARFASAESVRSGGVPALRALLEAEPAASRPLDAAIVMSHHFASDRDYLDALSASAIPYIGLLGPAMRRERLLAGLGERAQALRSRLRSPVGLDLGARTPEGIALAIVAEIHARLNGRDTIAAWHGPSGQVQGL